ncbi:DUF3343 domain-containing protein [Arabiibacter massiliensis]|uniref:DUF3343 domain-containing protein n=1 Tax=Arabiibacter massiliensis TaxID=1870985 RepID=UPI0009BA4200|nr:DUF3343 domain-containing protein [Arabiibacter massiliensis]
MGFDYVLAFESTHAAMAADKFLSPGGAKLIPTPRAVSAGCGMSLRFTAADDAEALARVRSVEAARGLAALYRMEDGACDLVERL